MQQEVFPEVTNFIKMKLFKFILLYLWLVTRVFGMSEVAASNYKKLIYEYENFPTDANKIKLFESLATCGKYANFDDQINKEVYLDLQNACLKIPRHADYFQDQIDAMYDPATNKPILEKYYYQRHLIRETLCHIPSPEMVWLLGEMLEDERGKIDDPKHRLGATSNADWACSALMLIGLENMPVPRGKGMFPVESAYLRKDTWKLWWGPIKAGNRTFSFAGQEKDYRFRKNGTYETISRTGEKKKFQNSDSNQSVPEVENKPTRRWIILMSGFLVLFGWWWWWKSKHRKA